jgi:hypothetical protein
MPATKAFENGNIETTKIVSKIILGFDVVIIHYDDIVDVFAKINVEIVTKINNQYMKAIIEPFFVEEIDDPKDSKEVEILIVAEPTIQSIGIQLE